MPTEKIYNGQWEKRLVEQFKKRDDPEISECESDEGDDVEMDNTRGPNTRMMTCLETLHT